MSRIGVYAHCRSIGVYVPLIGQDLMHILYKGCVCAFSCAYSMCITFVPCTCRCGIGKEEGHQGGRQEEKASAVSITP